MYKLVLHIPEDDDVAERLAGLRWHETDDPHGPHIKTQTVRDAETGETMLTVRMKHTSWEKVEALLTIVKDKGGLH